MKCHKYSNLLYEGRDGSLYDDYATLAENLVTRKKKLKLKKLMSDLRAQTNYEKLALHHAALITYVNKLQHGSLYELIYKLEKKLEDARLCEEQLVLELSKELQAYPGKIDKDILELFKKINSCLLDIINSRPSKLILAQQTDSPRKLKKRTQSKKKPFELAFDEIEQAEKGKEMSSTEPKEKLPSKESSENREIIKNPDIIIKVQAEPLKIDIEEKHIDEKKDVPKPTELVPILPLIIHPPTTSVISEATTFYRDELEQLDTSRLVSHNRKLFEELIEKSKVEEKKPTEQLRALVSPRYIPKDKSPHLKKFGIFNKAQSLPENNLKHRTELPNTARGVPWEKK